MFNIAVVGTSRFFKLKLPYFKITVHSFINTFRNICIKRPSLISVRLKVKFVVIVVLYIRPFTVNYAVVV